MLREIFGGFVGDGETVKGEHRKKTEVYEKVRGKEDWVIVDGTGEMVA